MPVNLAAALHKGGSFVLSEVQTPNQYLDRDRAPQRERTYLVKWHANRLRSHFFEEGMGRVVSLGRFFHPQLQKTVSPYRLPSTFLLFLVQLGLLQNIFSNVASCNMATLAISEYVSEVS